MELPKASRTVKRTIDLVHLFAASVWLGGFAVLFVLTLSDGAALGLASLDAPVAIDAFRSQFIVPCSVSYGNGSAVWRSDFMGVRQA